MEERKYSTRRADSAPARASERNWTQRNHRRLLRRTFHGDTRQTETHGPAEETGVGDGRSGDRCNRSISPRWVKGDQKNITPTHQCDPV